MKIMIIKTNIRLSTKSVIMVDCIDSADLAATLLALNRNKTGDFYQIAKEKPDKRRYIRETTNV